mmetsp:Transcript_9923/g.23289  ORF Transcript_9923/g.23289 Transcript_9923/m.23289 type:complete len:393 (-) Transcript_9923:177-1355(-)
MPHRPAQPVNQLAHDRQPHAAAAFPRREKRREDALLQPRRHAWAVVRHAQPQPRTTAQPGLDHELRRWPAGAGLQRVLGQVDDDLLQLGHVGAQHQRLRLDRDAHPPARGLPGRRQQPLHGLQQRQQRRVDQRRRQWLADAAVALDKRLQMRRPAGQRGKCGLQFVVLARHQQRRCAAGQRRDRRQRIHDLVRQHLHQLAPGHQCLGLQLRLDGRQGGQPPGLALYGQCRHGQHGALKAVFGGQGDDAPAGRGVQQREQGRRIGGAARCDQTARRRVQRQRRAAGDELPQGQRRVLEGCIEIGVRHRRRVGRQRCRAAGQAGQCGPADACGDEAAENAGHQRPRPVPPQAGPRGARGQRHCGGGGARLVRGHACPVAGTAPRGSGRAAGRPG